MIDSRPPWVAVADAIIREAIDTYRPSAIFALFSGGHDSLCSTHVAMQHPEATSALHINTGIGVEDTRRFVRETCTEQRWPLIERHPPSTTYDEMVLAHGFPGPGGHLYPYVWLKERALHQIVREAKVGRQPVMLITGVRKQESDRRMGHVEPIAKQKNRAIIWVAPLTDWSARQVGEYIEESGLKRNPVVDILHMSGECICGGYAKPGELKWISEWYPEVGERIRHLEARAKAAGVHCVWGVRPPTFYTEKRRGQMEFPLCFSCAPGDDESE